MKNAVLPAIFLVAILSAQGCATKEYGRQSPVTGYEQDSMTCQDIDRELAKVVAFVEKMHQADKSRDSIILANLENFWIGNTLERGAALDSANARIVGLWKLRDTKKCDLGASAEARTIPVQKPEVAERF